MIVGGNNGILDGDFVVIFDRINVGFSIDGIRDGFLDRWLEVGAVVVMMIGIMLELIEGWDDEWEDACKVGSYDGCNEG